MDHQLFEISQNVILARPDGAVLVLEHKSSGKWLLPGGRINKGEGWLEGLRREVREETGITDFHIKGIVDFDTWFEGAAGKCVITFVASVQSADVKLGDEHVAYAWVKQDDLGKYDFWSENIKKRIEKSFNSSLL
jgi:8-oxo-dGTP diphosphatase